MFMGWKNETEKHTTPLIIAVLPDIMSILLSKEVTINGIHFLSYNTAGWETRRNTT